jgi:HlyD family secretion protein
MRVIQKKTFISIFLLSGVLSGILLALTACKQETKKWMAPGTVEWDRVAVLAELSEPVVSVDVHEGDVVQAGQLLLKLDTRRSEAELHAAQAKLLEAQSNLANALREENRAKTLKQSNTISQEALELAETTARLASAAVEGAKADLEHVQLTLQRLEVRAPRAGRVDALPYRLGDQPPPGAALVSMLVGDAPYARVYVPEPWRASLKVGQIMQVKVDGIEKPFDAMLRSIRSEPGFTPYYALSGEDASRLSYRAELVLEGDVAQLPPGLPCHAEAKDDNALPHANDSH